MFSEGRERLKHSVPVLTVSRPRLLLRRRATLRRPKTNIQRPSFICLQWDIRLQRDRSPLSYLKRRRRSWGGGRRTIRVTRGRGERERETRRRARSEQEWKRVQMVVGNGRTGWRGGGRTRLEFCPFGRVLFITESISPNNSSALDRPRQWRPRARSLLRPVDSRRRRVPSSRARARG